jgi:hypothetical protein
LARTLVGFSLAAIAIAIAWAGLEEGGAPLGPMVAVVALALAPGLALTLTRRWAIAAAVAAVSAFAAFMVAFDRTLLDARPRDPERDFFGPVLSSFRQGFLDFFDTRLPFDRAAFPDMHGVTLLAAFGFALLAGVAIAARRPILAIAVVAVGAGWPATMSTVGIESGRGPVFGAFILATALALLVLTRPGTRSLAPAAAVGAVLVAAALVGSSSDAVAKSGFVKWATWDLYDRPDEPVNLSYIWDGRYSGIDFPDKRTIVLRVKASSGRRYLYWRATTLDEYTGSIWRERLSLDDTGSGTLDVGASDPLLPDAALRGRRSWVRQDVTVEALGDSRLVAAAQAVQWQAPEGVPVALSANGTVTQARPFRRGDTYTVWSYLPDQARPKALAEAGTSYPSGVVEAYLRAQPALSAVPLPEFDDPGRGAEMEQLFSLEPSLVEHRPLYEQAKAVTQGQDSPYEATIALLSWFRGDAGGFVYTEHPPVTRDKPPLVAFLETKQGYCQHFAGAMALMLRYLGIPARVAVGFTSGSYDATKKEWVVTDHEAHAWVEVYFPRFGWLTFDPTPARGQLSEAYEPFSTAFDARQAAQLGQAFLGIPEVGERAALLEARERGATGTGGGVTGTVTDKGGSIVGLLLLLAAGAAVGVLLLKALVRRLRLARRDPRGLAAACRRDLAGYLADQGRPVPASATPRELGALAEDAFGVNAEPFAAALDTARYGPPAVAAAGARGARTELRRLRRRLGARIGLVGRVRGALSLRSLSG